MSVLSHGVHPSSGGEMPLISSSGWIDYGGHFTLTATSSVIEGPLSLLPA